MKSHGIRSTMKSSREKTLLFTIYLIGLIIGNSSVKSSPSWDTQPTITDFGRNIRQLPCVSRRTGETGVCMFAYSCAKVNGTHLGTCIDRFYFGSCCKTTGTELDVVEPDNYLHNLDGDVVGPAAVTSNHIKLGSPTTSTTDRYNGGTSQANYASSSNFPSSSSFPSSSFASSSSFPSSSSSTTQQSYRPTTQFAVHSSSTPSTTTSSSTTSTTTSRNQYTEISNSIGTRPTFTLGSASTIASAYSTTISQSTKPMPSTTFSTVKPSVKPSSSYKPPPIRDQMTTTTRPKPQTAKPTVQFTVPTSSSTASNYSPYSSSSSSSSFSGHETTRPATTATAGQTYTTMASLRPINSSAITTTFATMKPVVKPSSTTYKSTAPPASTTASTVPQKTKPPPAAKPTAKPKPSSARPDLHSSTFESSTGSPSYTIRSTLDNVTENAAANYSAATTALNYQSQTPSYGSSSTTVTSTSPTLVTWTTLDKVPSLPFDSTKPPSATYKPSAIEGSTLPSWVKLPVETHEPNTGTPSKDSSTSMHSSTSTMSKPTTPSDNDISMNSIGSSSTQYPSSTLMAMMSSMLSSTEPPPTPTSTPTPTPTTTPTTPTATSESFDDLDAPLNMSNYKEVCGRRLFPTARIVGGEKVNFGKWPWQISLRQWRTSTYLHKCGAALFNENWAVTAAHCVENVPPSDLLLRLGEHDLSVEEEPYGYEERRIQIVASHPQFDPRTFEYDLALLRFYEPVKFQPNIIPVCVPEDDSNFVSSSAYVTGWGRLYEDGPLPSVLQEVTVPVINNSVCETMYRAAGYIEHIPDIFICAGWKKGGFDSCEGDSGGPMVIQRPDKRWLLAGIISWGIGCAEPNQPGVYTRISKFKDWINQILQF